MSLFCIFSSKYLYAAHGDKVIGTLKGVGDQTSIRFLTRSYIQITTGPISPHCMCTDGASGGIFIDLPD